MIRRLFLGHHKVIFQANGLHCWICKWHAEELTSFFQCQRRKCSHSVETDSEGSVEGESVWLDNGEDFSNGIHKFSSHFCLSRGSQPLNSFCAYFLYSTISRSSNTGLLYIVLNKILHALAPENIMSNPTPANFTTLNSPQAGDIDLCSWFSPVLPVTSIWATSAHRFKRNSMKLFTLLLTQTDLHQRQAPRLHCLVMSLTSQ